MAESIAGNELKLVQIFPVKGGDFAAAGSVSILVKKLLKGIGLPAPVLRRAAIAAFEAEMNLVMYGGAGGGEARLYLSPEKIRVEMQDRGPGIPNLELAMTEGWSTATAEMRELGFGAGMGLPNIKRNSDRFDIETVIGQGTSVNIEIDINSTSGDGQGGEHGGQAF